MTDDTRSLEWMEESLELIAEWTQGGRDAFLGDSMRREAVIGRMEHMANEANLLSKAVKRRHPAIDWDRMRDFRNVVAHGYRDVDVTRVRAYVETDLPDLRRMVREELERDRERTGELDRDS